MSPIRCGYPIEIFRIQRNGIESFGIFCSTPVVEIREKGIIETYNSIYRLLIETTNAKATK